MVEINSSSGRLRFERMPGNIIKITFNSYPDDQPIEIAGSEWAKLMAALFNEATAEAVRAIENEANPARTAEARACTCPMSVRERIDEGEPGSHHSRDCPMYEVGPQERMVHRLANRCDEKYGDDRTFPLTADGWRRVEGVDESGEERARFFVSESGRVVGAWDPDGLLDEMSQ